jgi:hypothetical protein
MYVTSMMIGGMSFQLCTEKGVVIVCCLHVVMLQPPSHIGLDACAAGCVESVELLWQGAHCLWKAVA